MRYIKVLLLVCVFFLVMMFFVQNQASFADPVILRADLFFLPPMESIPIPLYALMLMCFGVGALIVLLMLVWDRITITGKLSNARHRVIALQKKLEKMTEALRKSEEEKKQAQAKMKEELKLAEQRVAAALRASHVSPASSALPAKAEFGKATPISKEPPHALVADAPDAPDMADTLPRAASMQNKPVIATGLTVTAPEETQPVSVPVKRGFFSKKPKA